MNIKRKQLREKWDRSTSNKRLGKILKKAKMNKGLEKIEKNNRLDRRKKPKATVGERENECCRL